MPHQGRVNVDREYGERRRTSLMRALNYEKRHRTKDGTVFVTLSLAGVVINKTSASDLLEETIDLLRIDREATEAPACVSVPANEGV
mgnify:CR=1 FL=1